MLSSVCPMRVASLYAGMTMERTFLFIRALKDKESVADEVPREYHERTHQGTDIRRKVRGELVGKRVNTANEIDTFIKKPTHETMKNSVSSLTPVAAV